MKKLKFNISKINKIIIIMILLFYVIIYIYPKFLEANCNGLLLISTLYFILLFLNIYSQWSSAAIALINKKDMIIKLLLIVCPIKDSIINLKNIIINNKHKDIYGIYHENNYFLENEKETFEQHMKEIAEEIINSRSIRMKSYYLIFLPFMSLIYLIIYFSFLILVLQTFTSGMAFNECIITPNQDHSISTFISDYINCLYYSTVTLTTTGFGEIYPNFNYQYLWLIRFHITASLWIMMINIFLTLNISFHLFNSINNDFYDNKRLVVILREFITSNKFDILL